MPCLGLILLPSIARVTPPLLLAVELEDDSIIVKGGGMRTWNAFAHAFSIPTQHSYILDFWPLENNLTYLARDSCCMGGAYILDCWPLETNFTYSEKRLLTFTYLVTNSCCMSGTNARTWTHAHSWHICECYLYIYALANCVIGYALHWMQARRQDWTICLFIPGKMLCHWAIQALCSRATCTFHIS